MDSDDKCHHGKPKVRLSGGGLSKLCRWAVVNHLEVHCIATSHSSCAVAAVHLGVEIPLMRAPGELGLRFKKPPPAQVKAVFRA